MLCRRPHWSREGVKKVKKSKLLAVIVFVSVLPLIACNSKKEAELNQKILELSELNLKLQNERSDLQNKIAELENLNNDLSDKLNNMTTDLMNNPDEELYENHDISYLLKFEYGGLNTKVYPTPKIEDEIYTIQDNDEILITNVIRVKENDTVFVKAKLMPDSAIEGYVYLGRNPYKNGNFEQVAILDVNGNKIQTLKLDSTFMISEGICIRELPSEESNSLHEVTHKEGSNYYTSSEITSDYQWVKISLDEYTGWVPADALSRDIGGPTIDTPETTIYWELIGSNLI